MPAKGWRKEIHWTEEQEDRLLTLNQPSVRFRGDSKGLPIGEAAKAAGIPKRFALLILEKHGFQNRKTLAQVTEVDAKNMVELWLGKNTVKQIMATLGFSKRAVTETLRREGCNLKRKNHYTVDEHWFDTLDTREKRYYLGLFLADGMADSETDQVVLSQKVGFDEVIQRFKELVGYTGVILDQIGGGYPNRKPQRRINFSSRWMRQTLNSYGVVKGKALRCEGLPPVRREDMRDVILGYFDGDGSLYWYNTRSHFTKGNGETIEYSYPKAEFSLIGNRPFLEQVALTLTEDAGVRNVGWKPSSTPGLVYLRIWGQDSLRNLYHYLYDAAPVFIGEKHSRWLPLVQPARKLD